MITTNIGEIAIAHEPDWSGSATVTWADGEISLPAIILFQMLTGGTNLETGTTNMVDEVIRLGRDFENLRRQAAAFRSRMESAVQVLGDRVNNLSERITALENG